MRAITKFLMAGAAAAALTAAASSADAAVIIRASVNGGAFTELANDNMGPNSAGFGGVIGGWNFNIISGVDPDGDIVFQTQSSNSTSVGGSIEVQVTYTGLQNALPYLWTGLTSNSLGDGYTTTLSTYADGGNVAFGQATQLSTATFTNPLGLPGVGINNYDFITPYQDTGSYSLTAVYQISGQGPGSANSTINFEGGAVPEPGTWALMILGFGSAGAMLRSRRRVASVAA